MIPAAIISLLDASVGITGKAAHMAQTDPRGTTLTLVSVTVVFGALLILFCVYSITGKIFTSKRPRGASEGACPQKSDACSEAPAEEEIAAAIAVALYEEELAAASKNEEIHDYESGIITIKR